MPSKPLTGRAAVAAGAIGPALFRRVEQILESRLGGGEPAASLATELTTETGRYRASFHELPAHGSRPVVLVIAVEEEGSALPDPHRIQKRFGLTEREAEVAVLLAQRKRNAEIARKLFISEHTARRHTEKVLQKMGLNSRLDVRGALRSVASEEWDSAPQASLNVA